MRNKTEVQMKEMIDTNASGKSRRDPQSGKATDPGYAE